MIVSNEHMYGKEYEDVYGTLEEQTTFINALKNEIQIQFDGIFNADYKYLYQNLEETIKDAYYNFEYTINGDADNLLTEGFIVFIEVAQELMESIERINRHFFEQDFKNDCDNYFKCGENFKNYYLAKLKHDIFHIGNLVVSVEKYIYGKNN